jgi:hypothetical protein
MATGRALLGLFALGAMVACARSAASTRAAAVPLGDASIALSDVPLVDAGAACSGALCDGRCVDVARDARHCGACGAACPAVTNGASACVDGACAPSCAAGFVAVGDECVAPTPRPIAPLSTATVSSRRPTLRWRNPLGSDGALVTVCADRGCARAEYAADVTGESAAPPADLAPGAHYWRLQAHAGGGSSPTWEFFVGHRSAPRDTSAGTVPDFDGDGLADAVIGAPSGDQAGHAFVYPGRRGGLASTPAVQLDPPPAAPRTPSIVFGYSLASAGDLDGDGFADLVVSSWIGDIRLYPGGPAGIRAEPALVLPAPTPDDENCGRSMVSAGDVNGDGYADLLVGVNRRNGSVPGRAYVYYGSAHGVAAAPSVDLSSAGLSATGEALDDFGEMVASAGDIDGDGYGDVVIAAPRLELVLVYQGGPRGLAVTPSATLAGTAGVLPSFFGYSLAGPMDLNGDGLGDLAVGGFERGLSTYLGSSRGLVPSTGPVLPTIDSASDSYAQVLAAGDVNGDGFGDLAIARSSLDRHFTALEGAVYFFFGGDSALASTPSATLDHGDLGVGENRFGAAIGAPHDVDGDGFDDLLVWQARDHDRPGDRPVFLCPGGAAGPTLGAATILAQRRLETFGSTFAR